MKSLGKHYTEMGGDGYSEAPFPPPQFGGQREREHGLFDII